MTEQELLRHYTELSKNLESIFLAALREAGLQLSDQVVCRIQSNSIELGIKATGERLKKGYKMEFGSEIELYRKIEWFAKPNNISLASCGSFNPDNQASFWRIVHGAEILKHWADVCTAVNAVCQMYKNSQAAINKAAKNPD